ncbi:UDP-glucose/GDP-mannose dehydrogenase family protein [Candidatus Kaiserbacteria bacterium]|nr:UDP-glucose/GDP-mannose dehydrogenase family protein [Candidatus Kaiserbacteria bacterium]
MTGQNPLIGFIGQGFIGKNYADDFERRGYSVIRYALEEPYRANKDRIKDCDIVFVAVPTPTTVKGFDDSIVRAAISIIAPASIVVVKSTLAPGTTKVLQQDFPDLVILHSPEFLREATAAYDAAHPERNIIGVACETDSHITAAKRVLEVLPQASYTLVCSAREAEYIKYAGNAFLFLKVVFANLLYDATAADGCDWELIRQALGADSRIGPSHLGVLHASGHPNAPLGRGAGGHCFIKDFASLRAHYEKVLPHDADGIAVLRAFEEKNKALLKTTNKDLDLLAGVYGDTESSRLDIIQTKISSNVSG